MDLNTATNEQLEVYRATVAKTMNIDPLMLDFIWMNDSETGLRNRVLYAKRGAAEVLRHELKVSVTALTMTEKDGLVTFTAVGTIPSGRQEIAVGSAYIEGLRGDKKAHGVMTASTRAVRRLTLQFVTGGVSDETEVQAQSDLQIAPVASGAQLSGSPMVIPPTPLTVASAAPGRDITPTADNPAATELPPQTPEEFSAAQQALRDEAKAQLMARPGPGEPAGYGVSDPPKLAPASEAPAKVKRTRKARNTVSIASPGQVSEPSTTVPRQEETVGTGAVLRTPPVAEKVSTPAPPATVPLSGEVAVEKAQPVSAQIPTALLPIIPPAKPQPMDALLPEKATEFKNRLRVYANDVLPRGGMLPSDGVGGITMKLRAFAAKHTGATDTAALSLAQWEDLFDFLDSYAQKSGPQELVKYIDKAIGVAK